MLSANRHARRSGAVRAALALIAACAWPCVPAAAELDDTRYIVLPPERESGAFYLAAEPDPRTNRFPRKGYIPAFTPLTVAADDDGHLVQRWLSERGGAVDYVYYRFTSASGATGYIKQNSIERLRDVAVRAGRSLVDEAFRGIVVPIHPLEEVRLGEIDEDAHRVIELGRFSRSKNRLVVTDGTRRKFRIGPGTRKEFLRVRYFEPAPDGGPRIRTAWVDNSENTRRFMVVDALGGRHLPIRSREVSGWAETLRAFWDAMVNDYDDKALARAMGKDCRSTVEVRMKVSAGGELPVPVVALEGEASALRIYRFDRGYRYASEVLVDERAGADVRLLKTVRCKPGTSTDWYASRVVIARDRAGRETRFQIFQDQMLRDLSAYFETPDASGP